MVTIVDYKECENGTTGDKFFGLIVQGGIEAVKSKETGGENLYRLYSQNMSGAQTYRRVKIAICLI